MRETNRPFKLISYPKARLFTTSSAGVNQCSSDNVQHRIDYIGMSTNNVYINNGIKSQTTETINQSLPHPLAALFIRMQDVFSNSKYNNVEELECDDLIDFSKL